MRSIVVLAFVPLVAFGGSPVRRQLSNASEAVEDAYNRTRKGTPVCKQTIGAQLDTIVDTIDDLRKRPDIAQIDAVRMQLSHLAAAAPLSGCRPEVNDEIQKAIEQLDEARAALYSNGDGRRDDGPPQVQGGFAQLMPLAVQANANYQRQPAVKLSVPELRLTNLRGTQFYFAVKYRSYEGQWSEWVTTQVWTVPTDNYVWKNAFNHFLPYSTLAEDDFSGGRFVARISVFDSAGRELAFREAPFTARVPRLAEQPPVIVAPPLPIVPGSVPVRDCGLGADPGCVTTRDGQYAMDITVWAGFLQSLRGQPNEALRLGTLQQLLARNYLTAKQLGAVLDSFTNEALRIKAVELCGPRIINPQHALGFSNKFQNAMFRQSFTTMMSQQQTAIQTGVPVGVVVQPQQPPGPPGPPPPPGYQPPPGPPPPPGYQQPVPGYQQNVVVAVPVQGGGRDCGTGNDPGCVMPRNGAYAMDGMTFNGFMTALRTNNNELVREETFASLIERQYLTSMQLSQVLDLFNNELTRLDVAKKAAPHVVNPMHALGLAAKFQNSFNSRDYVQVMSAQR